MHDFILNLALQLPVLLIGATTSCVAMAKSRHRQMEKFLVEVSFFSDRTIRIWKHIIEVELKKGNVDFTLHFFGEE